MMTDGRLPPDLPVPALGKGRFRKGGGPFAVRSTARVSPYSAAGRFAHDFASEKHGYRA